jgi:hypothetical protein
LNAIIPAVGPSYGNGIVTIQGNGIPGTIPKYAPEIYCKFGTILCSSVRLC